MQWLSMLTIPESTWGMLTNPHARPNEAESLVWDPASIVFTRFSAHSTVQSKLRTTALGPHSGLPTK